MKFRTKLVLWHAGIVLVTLVAFRLASVGVIRGLLENDFDESLRAEARWVERLVRDYRTRGVPDAEIVMEIAERSRLAPRKEFIEVRDGAGQRFELTFFGSSAPGGRVRSPAAGLHKGDVAVFSAIVAEFAGRHRHAHTHRELVHAHPHVPDLHHRHPH